MHQALTDRPDTDYSPESPEWCRTVFCILSAVIITAGMEEQLTGLFQLLGIIDSKHPGYTITGNFYNSGPFACYLSVVFPVALRWAVAVRNRIITYVGAASVLLCALFIPATMSRTALLACVIGSVIALWDIIRHRLMSKRVVIPILAAVILTGSSAYYVKRDSADGRLLMWKIAAQTLSEAPVTGVGWKNVAGAYGDAQERYFASGRGSDREILVADAPEYVFNEYLQIGIAYGLFAACLMTAIIAGGIVTAFRSRAYAFAGSAAAAAIVMFASYPLQFPLFTLTITLVLMGAWLASSSKFLRLSASAIVAAGCVLFLYNARKPNIHIPFSEARMLHSARLYRESNEILLDILYQSSDPMPMNIIGKNYQALGMPDSAEYYFRRAADRCPNRLYPHYLLMHLYGDSLYLNRESRQKEAFYILNHHAKIISPAVTEIRHEAELIIKSADSQNH